MQELTSFPHYSQSKSGLGWAPLQKYYILGGTWKGLKGKTHGEGPNITMCHQAKDSAAGTHQAWKDQKGHIGCSVHCLSSPFLATFSHCGEEGPGRHKHALAPQLDCVKLTFYQMDIILFPSLLRFVTFRLPWNQISESRKSTQEANNYKITLGSFPGSRKKATQSRLSSATHPSPQQKQEDIGQPGLQGESYTDFHQHPFCNTVPLRLILGRRGHVSSGELCLGKQV